MPFPILMYHALSVEQSREKYVLTTTQFRSHLKLIRDAGQKGVSVEQITTGRSAYDASVILTFDDGHISNKEQALPILEEFGYSATFYITTGYIGSSPEWMTWKDLQALKDAGMDIGVHGHTHRFMDELNDADLELELRQPLFCIEEHLGFRPRHLAYPGGRYDQAANARAFQCGYVTLATSKPGLVSFDPQRKLPLLLDRFVVHQGTDTKTVSKLIERDWAMVAKNRMAYQLKWAIKKALGNRLYHHLWKLKMEGYR